MYYFLYLVNYPGIKEFNPKDYNPRDIPTNPTVVKGFLIKVNKIDEIIKSFNEKSWIVNKYTSLHVLDDAFRKIGERGPIYLFFQVDGEDNLCGMARMTNKSNFHKDKPKDAKDIVIPCILYYILSGMDL